MIISVMRRRNANERIGRNKRISSIHGGIQPWALATKLLAGCFYCVSKKRLEIEINGVLLLFTISKGWGEVDECFCENVQTYFCTYKNANFKCIRFISTC